jgi:hypothetical protein
MEHDAGELFVAVREDVRLHGDAFSDHPLDRVAAAVDLGLHAFDGHPPPRVNHSLTVGEEPCQVR